MEERGCNRHRLSTHQKWSPNYPKTVPIEIKMNWDQFKPKYKNRQPVRSEALTILDRFAAAREEFESISPILVVIQGEWRRVTKMQNKENGLQDLQTAGFPVEMVCFDEKLGSIVRNDFGA